MPDFGSIRQTVEAQPTVGQSMTTLLSAFAAHVLEAAAQSSDGDPVRRAVEDFMVHGDAMVRAVVNLTVAESENPPPPQAPGGLPDGTAPLAPQAPLVAGAAAAPAPAPAPVPGSPASVADVPAGPQGDPNAPNVVAAAQVGPAPGAPLEPQREPAPPAPPAAAAPAPGAPDSGVPAPAPVAPGNAPTARNRRA